MLGYLRGRVWRRLRRRGGFIWFQRRTTVPAWMNKYELVLGEGAETEEEHFCGLCGGVLGDDSGLSHIKLISLFNSKPTKSYTPFIYPNALSIIVIYLYVCAVICIYCYQVIRHRLRPGAWCRSTVCGPRRIIRDRNRRLSWWILCTHLNKYNCTHAVFAFFVAGRQAEFFLTGLLQLGNVFIEVLRFFLGFHGAVENGEVGETRVGVFDDGGNEIEDFLDFFGCGFESAWQKFFLFGSEDCAVLTQTYPFCALMLIYRY